MLRSYSYWFFAMLGIFCVFYFAGHLNLISSLLLGLLLAGMLGTQKETKHIKAGANFLPHFARFTPNIGKMLIDLGIVTQSQWEEKMAQPANNDPWSGDYLCRRGVYAYALFLDSEQSRVVHWPKLAIYTEDFSLRREIDNFVMNDGTHFFPEWYPMFILRRVGKGYGLIVEVRTRWWDEYGSKTQIGNTKDHESNPITGTTQIVFEVFPYEAFWQFTAARAQIKSERATAAIQSSGWNLTDYGSAPELHFMQPDFDYQSEYADISTNFLRAAK